MGRRLDMARVWWRPFGLWGLSINVTIGFPALYVFKYLRPELDLGILAGAYATLLATWTAAAGIRAFEKTKDASNETPAKPR